MAGLPDAADPSWRLDSWGDAVDAAAADCSLELLRRAAALRDTDPPPAAAACCEGVEAAGIPRMLLGLRDEARPRFNPVWMFDKLPLKKEQNVAVGLIIHSSDTSKGNASIQFLGRFRLDQVNCS